MDCNCQWNYTSFHHIRRTRQTLTEKTNNNQPTKKDIMMQMSKSFMHFMPFTCLPVPTSQTVALNLKKATKNLSLFWNSQHLKTSNKWSHKVVVIIWDKPIGKSVWKINREMRLLFPQMDLWVIDNRGFPQVCKYWTPSKNFPSAVFLTTTFLITSVNTGSSEGHLRHWQPLTKKRLPLASIDCMQALLEKKPKVVVPVGPSMQHPFFWLPAL